MTDAERNVADVLRDALKAFDGGKRWVAGGGPEPDACAYLAVARASKQTRDGLRTSFDSMAALLDVLRSEYADRIVSEYPDNPFVAAFRFNDHPDTTFADVERVFEKAIANAESAL